MGWPVHLPLVRGGALVRGGGVTQHVQKQNKNFIDEIRVG